jgi:DeoR family glycerol-3-phosphate regulon repressor
VRVSQALIRRARRTFLVADASKFQRSAPVRIVSLREIDALYTDKPLSANLTAQCREWETEVALSV